MSVGQENNTVFEDISHGEYGLFAWMAPFGAMFCSFFFLMALYVLFTREVAFSEDFIGTVMGVMLFLAFCVWFHSATIYALNTIQIIKFLENKVYGKLYFNRKYSFDLHDVVKINNYDVTWLMSQAVTFPDKGHGITIYLKNGKKYKISPNMPRFDELKKILIEAVEKNPL